jgi:formylglycine-generating enzyme required for sulfatase activity
MPTSPTYIVNDQPTDKDALDFTPYVETLADIIQTGNTPLTIGVFGTWGSGKTSLMRMVKKQLPGDFTIAWFDAWKYDKEETLWRAFLLSVLTAVRSTIKEGQPTEDLEYLETMLYRNIEIEKAGGVTIDLAKLGGAVAKGGVQLALSFIPGGAVLSEFVKKVQQLGAEALTDDATEAIQRERTKIQIEQVRFLEQFQVKFRHLVEQHVSNNGKRLVVFVDDLDRCLPEKAIEVLEAIKLFLDAENCIFVLGLDQEVIARGIEMKYKELGAKQDGDGQGHFTIEGVRYLEKIIQLPFIIPPVEPSDMGDFVHGLSDPWPHEECPKIFAEGLGDNPRQIKRTVNTFLMLWKLAQKREEKLKGKVKPIRLAKVVAIQTVYPDLYNLLLKEEPRYLRELEEYYRSESSQEGKAERGDALPRAAKSEAAAEKAIVRVEPPPALVPFLSRRGAAAVRRILTMHSLGLQDANFAGLPPEELKLYFTLTRRAEAPQPTPPPEAARLVFEPQIVKIPAGKFLMGSTPEQIAQAIEDGIDKDWVQNETPQHTIELSDYSIGKYPITNREYQAFVRDAKFKPPNGWDGDQFPDGKGSHPIVNVSWDDATAYCKWLGEKSGKAYRLPTEAEWEKAARGEDGRVYPWGDVFDPQKANTSETKLGDTSDVGKFSPQGDSPYACADMAGNVWEWCNDWFDEKEYKTRKDVAKNPQGAPKGDARVLRGGAFSYEGGLVRCAVRYERLPGRRGNLIGFRVVVSSPISLGSRSGS